MVCMATVTGLAGDLALNSSAQTAVLPAQLTVLALAYDQHVAQRARQDGGAGPHCGHVSEPPYIVMPGAEDRACCARCAAGALPPAGLQCAECPGETAVYMFSYGDVVAAATICQDCGGISRAS
jgi:hypothetical protein